MKTTYEWSFNEMDEEDIIDNHFCDKLSQSDYDPSELGFDDLNLELVKSVYASDGELLDRQYAEVSNEMTMTEFDGGDAIPKKYIKELSNWS